MLNTETFYSILEGEIQHPEDVEVALTALLKEYPWFEVGHSIYATLPNSSPIRIKTAAIYAQDRNLLKDFIANKNTLHSTSTPTIESSSANEENNSNHRDDNSTPKEVDRLLEFSEQKYTDKIIDVKSETIITNETKGTFELDEVETPIDNDLIDEFLKNAPRIVPPKVIPAEQKDISVESIKEPDDVATELLAQIFVEQKLFAKAISTYEKLCLKYPEKSAYFAGQIEEIKKLLLQ